MNEQAVTKIKSYFEKKPDVVAVYLFGSCASGKDRRTSDVDLGILLQVSELTNTQDKRNDYIVELARLLRKDIHPVILNSASEALIRQIFFKGKCILVNDSQELYKFKMIMTARIADFWQYRNMMKLGFIRKVMEG